MRLSFLRSLLLGLGWVAAVLLVRIGWPLWETWRAAVARGQGSDKVFVLVPLVSLWLLLGPPLLLLGVWAVQRLLQLRVASDATKSGAR